MYMFMNSKMKRRLNKRLKNISRKDRKEFLRRRYNGYLNYGDTKGYVYSKYRYDNVNMTK